MKRFAALAVLSLWLGIDDLYAQQTEFPIGIFTFDGDSIDYHQMKDTLGIGWVQGWGGEHGSPSELETNPESLKIMSMRWNPYVYSKAQRMVYEAEHNIWQDSIDQYMWNFFQTKETGDDPVGEIGHRCQESIDTPGYMVRRPWPSCSDFPTYFYDRQYYFATFRMKTTKATPDTETVAVLSILIYHNGSVIDSVRRVLYDSSFTSDSLFYDFRLAFTLQLDTNAQTPAGEYLAGTPTRASRLKCDSVDIRVYWTGHRTTWLDKVTVDDSYADSLFAHMYDGATRAQVDDFLLLSNVKRTYLFDEPQLPAFRPYLYVKEFIRDSVLPGNNRPAITASPWTDNWAKRFNQEAQPDEFLFDRYVITADVPSPSMTAAQANDAGVVEYTSNSQYNDSIQSRWDLLESGLAPIAALAHGLTPPKPIWFVPHLHGEYIVGTGQYRRHNSSATLRPPTGVEIQAQINIGLAFGAKGIVSFPYGTLPDEGFDTSGAWMPGVVSRDLVNGKYTDHSKDTASLPGPNGSQKVIYIGYREKWDSLASINKKLMLLGDTLKNLTWQGTRSWWSDESYGSWSDIVSSAGTAPIGGQPEAPPFPVLVGHMKANQTDYLYIVNRRSDNGDIRAITFTVAKTGNWLLAEVLTNRAWVSHNTRAIVDTFMPGEGKLYRLSSAEVAGTVVFPQLKFLGGATLTLADGACVTAKGSMDTVRFLLGNNATFIADTGSAMVVSTYSAFSPNATCSLKFYGTLTIADSVALKFMEGTSVLLGPGAQVLLGPGAGLESDGTLSAQGTASNPVRFKSSSLTPAPGDWQMITLKGGPNTLLHCVVEYSHGGVYVNNTSTNLLDSCTVRHSDGYGVQAFNTSLTANSVKLRDCTIDSNNAGLWVGSGRVDIVQSSATYGIRDNGYAVVLQTGGKVYLNNAHIKNNDNWGVFVNGTTAQAVLSPNGINRGYNRVRDNISGQIWVQTGSAFLGNTNTACRCDEPPGDLEGVQSTSKQPHGGGIETDCLPPLLHRAG